MSLDKLRIGPFPLPMYLVLLAVVCAASAMNKLPADMVGGFAVLLVIGVLLGHLGQSIPVLKDIGGPAILSIFILSIMVHYELFNATTIKSITTLTKDANFLYLYISALVTGSILGMNRSVLVQGFQRMLVPLTVGALASIAVGIGVGLLFG